MQTNTTKRRVKRKDNPVSYEIKRAYDERDKRQERIGRARKLRKRQGGIARTRLQHGGCVSASPPPCQANRPLLRARHGFARLVQRALSLWRGSCSS